MRRILKILAIAVGVVVLALIALIVAAPLLIDPNDYKPQIVQAVRENTGRELDIQGDIGLSFFPWLGVELNELALSNARGFGPEPFASIESATLRVKLLPLLRREVMIDRVRLSGLDLNLAVNKAGRNNWEDLVPAEREAAPAPAEPAGPQIEAFAIDGVEVRDGEISYRDATTGAAYALHDVRLDAGRLELGRPTDVQLSFELESTSPALRTPVALRTTAMLDLDRQRLVLEDLALEMLGLNLQGEIAGEQILDAPRFTGAVEVPPFDPRALLARLGMPLETADPKALARASLKSRFDASADALALTDLAATLDDTALAGSIRVANFARPAYRFDLNVDQLDLDRYLPPEATTTEPAAPGQAPPPATTEAAAEPMLETLRALDAEGKLRVGQLKAFGLRTSDASLGILAKEGLVRAAPVQARLYTGSYQGTLSLDARGKTPRLQMEQNLKGVQLGPLLKDAQVYDKFTGRANVQAKLTAAGLDMQRLVRTLTGTAAVVVDDGSLQGVDLARMREQIEEMIRARQIEGVGNLAPKPGEETRFDAMKASARIENGVVHTENLDLRAAGLEVDGKGTVNLVEESMDYLLLINELPLKITGPFDALRFRPDWSAILKAETEKRLEKEKEKLKGRQEELGRELEEKLEKKLEDFLRR